MSKQIELKLNTDLQGKKAGESFFVDIDVNGTIKDKYWRDRLYDSKHDECVEIIHEKETIKEEVATEDAVVVPQAKEVKPKRKKRQKENN